MNDVQERIYEIVKHIPKGRVCTYGDIQKACGLKTPRIVGHYLHKNMDSGTVPCHRVVHSDGRLANSYAFGGYGVQESMLRREGVVFKGAKVDLTVSRILPDLMTEQH